MSAAPKLACVSVADAGRIVGNGRGLDGAREDALARRVRILEVRLGRPLREPEIADVEAWASTLADTAALEPTSDAPEAAPPPAPPPPSPPPPPPAPRQPSPVTPEGQVILFPSPSQKAGTGEADNAKPRLCAGCRAELPAYLGRGCPRRFCLACRPRVRPLAVADEAPRPARPLALADEAPRPARPPRRRRSGATGGQGLIWPELAGACLGCKGNLAPYAGIGGPRRWCEACRPPRQRNPRQTPRVGDRVQVEGTALLVVGRARIPLGGRQWRGAVEVRRPNGRLVLIPLADWRAMHVEVLHGA